MQMMKLLLVSLVAFAVGCGGSMGPPPVPVSGKVTLGATVTFLSTTGGRSASGKTGSDGSFKLSTINTDDGARPGEYNVTIAKIESKLAGKETDVEKGEYGENYDAMMMGAASNDMSKVQKNTLPDKYASPTESGLSRTVVKGEENNFLFDL